MNWQSGLSLGDATLTAHRAASGWDFDVTVNAGVPGFAMADTTARLDRCRPLFAGTGPRPQPRRQADPREDHLRPEGRQRDAHHPVPGGRRQQRPSTFPPARATPWRSLITPAWSWGKAACLPAQQVFFGSAYTVRMDYTGAQNITVDEKPTVTDQLMRHREGAESRISHFEMFFARDAGAHAAPDPRSAPAWGRSRWSWCAEMRVAFFSPLPPARSGIADYSEALLESLKPLVDRGGFLQRRPARSTPRASISRSTRSATTPSTISSTRPRCAIPAWW